MAIILFLQNTKKCFCFWEIDLSAMPWFLLVFADVIKRKSVYGSKQYTNRLHLTDSTNWPSFMIRALAKLDQLKILKMQTSSKFLVFFGQFLDVVGLHNQFKRHATCIYSERTFYWLSYPFCKTRNWFCFGEIDLLEIP